MFIAVRTGLEPVTPCVTGMYSNQLNYRCFLSRLRCKGTTKFGITKYLKIIFRKKVRKFLYSKNKSYI